MNEVTKQTFEAWAFRKPDGSLSRGFGGRPHLRNADSVNRGSQYGGKPVRVRVTVEIIEEQKP